MGQGHVRGRSHDNKKLGHCIPLKTTAGQAALQHASRRCNSISCQGLEIQELGSSDSNIRKSMAMSDNDVGVGYNRRF